MTQIIYLKCQDAQIIICDRKQTDGVMGEGAKKYHLPHNREFVLALAGDGQRIEQIFSNLISELDIAGNTARDKVIESIENSPTFSGETKMSSGTLLIREQGRYQFNHVQISNSTQYVVDDDPKYRCYGSGSLLANYLIRKFLPYNYNWQTALQYLIAIMNEIADSVDSVGSLGEYGYDVILIQNSCEMKVCTLESGVNSEINMTFSPDSSMNFECLESIEEQERVEQLQPAFQSVSPTPHAIKPIEQKTIKSTLNVEFQNTKYPIDYEISNASVSKVSFSASTVSIMLSLETRGKGKLVLALPRALLDSKIIESGINEDADFIVLIDDEEAEFTETIGIEHRTLTISVEDGATQIEIIGTHHPIAIRTDNDKYTYGNKMIITVLNPHIDFSKSMELEILDKSNNPIYSKTISVDEKANHKYQDIVSIQGKKWRPDSEYTINVKFGEQSASTKIRITGFGMILELDQKIYTWTDKVYIALVAPDLNTDPEKIETIGHDTKHTVTIKTSKGELDYLLQESGEDTGIFTGEVNLTGFTFDKTKESGLPRGTTTGHGPTDGFLAVTDKDFLRVSVKTPTTTISADALVRWNIGEVQWLNASYLPTEEAIIRVVDPDMNLDSNTIDTVEINIWSDSDAQGIKIKLKETDTATGIFMGKVRFTTTEESHDDVLRVSNGDTIVASYADFTLPEPYSIKDEISITSTAFIGETMPPLLRLVSSPPRIFDAYGNELAGGSVGQELTITSSLTNNQDREQNFAYFVTIRDQKGNQDELLHTIGSVSPGKTENPTIIWKPRRSGIFTVSTFVWESIDNPTALSYPMDCEIEIVDDNFKYISKSSQHAHLFPNKHTISIPFGTGTPGCEMTDQCFMPSELMIGVNQLVIWKNNDAVAHTITSGNPRMGTTGVFDSGLINSGKSFAFYFKEKGTYEYHCLIHPWQQGRIIVE